MNNKLHLLLLACLIIVMPIINAQETQPTRVACIGNSITYGAGIKNRLQNSYPGILQHFLGANYDVRNFGVSGRTLLSKGDYPYINESAYKAAQTFLPNIVIIKLGTNDSKPHNWIHKEDFKKDLEALVTTFQSLSTKPGIYLCLPVPATKIQWGINDSIITHEIIPIIRKVSQEKKTHIIDLHTALLPYPQDFPDCVHPNEHGSMLMASEIYRSITGKEPSTYSPEQPFPGKKTNWEGFERYDFTFNGRAATIVAPRQATSGRPWIWRPAFFGAFASVDKSLLNKGFHVVYYDLTHLYGSPHAVQLGTDFYHAMCQYYNFSSKVVLEGFSRGGLFVFNWAAQHPDKVACIYADAPVCNLLSWPGRKNHSLWTAFLKEWNVKDTDVDYSFKGNVINTLSNLAEAHIPIISVCGDSDKTVPYLENMKPVSDTYRTMGGIIEVILKPGCDHHPHSLDNPEPIVDFILRYQNGYSDK